MGKRRSTSSSLRYQRTNVSTAKRWRLCRIRYSRHTLAIEMIRHGASFEDVAATLGNTVAVVAKFYSHEWGKVRQHRTDAAIKAAWQ